MTQPDRPDTQVDALGALECENERLRALLREAEDTLRALRGGEVDAIVVGEDIYTLQSAEASDHRLRGDVLTRMEDAVVVFDGTDHVVYLNPAAQRLYGVEASMVLGLTREHLYRPDGPQPADAAQAARALDEHGSWRGQEHQLTRCGQRLLVDCRLSRLQGDDGAAQGTLMVARDVTQHEAAQAALRESQARLLFTLESARVGEWELDPATRQWRGSLRQARCFGFDHPVPGWTYQRFIAMVCQVDRAEVDAKFQQALAGGELHLECCVDWPDGTQHWLEMHGSLLGQGAAARLVGIVWETTERRRTEALLRDADQRKDEFLATLAHELRNPLAPIRNSVYLLRRSPHAQARDTALATIERQLGHMVRLVDDLLDVSRISRGRIELQRELVDVAAVIDSAVETSRPAIDARRHRLSVKLPAMPVRIDADPTRLSQVMANLLNNAAKFTPEGGEIALEVALHGQEIELSVRDNGVGIRADMLVHVFEMFTQIDRTLQRSQGGLGIGLALVAQLVGMHGGRVSASSEGEGRGALFTVTLPLPSGAVADTAACIARAQPQADGAAGPNVRVLVVDDNHDSADSLALALGAIGYEVQTAYDGGAAVERARSFLPHAVLLDIGLPTLDGYQAARLIRAQCAARPPMLVAVTGWGQDQDVDRSAQSAFDHHLVKPVPFDRLLEVLAKAR